MLYEMAFVGEDLSSIAGPDNADPSDPHVVQKLIERKA
ncbi:hypothetical protein CFII64_17336 [Pseudomonas sp. CFII64]|nr:hypothetical protein CFII64_17336 [Pseudomonas sp. CFII64]